MAQVAVIVPNYNHARFLRQRLLSIENQSFANTEVVLLDDCSTDNSALILQEFAAKHPNWRFVANERNSGSPFAQWKKGIQLTSAPYVWIAESDDSAEPNLLECLVGHLDKNPNLSVAFAQSFAMNEQGEVTGDWRQHTAKLGDDRWQHSFIQNGREHIGAALVLTNTIPNASAAVFRRDRIPAMDEIARYRLNGDRLFWIRLLQQGDVYYEEKCLNYFRSHENSVRSTTKNVQSLKENLEISLIAKQISRPPAFIRLLLVKRFFREWELFIGFVSLRGLFSQVVPSLLLIAGRLDAQLGKLFFHRWLKQLVRLISAKFVRS